MDITDILEQHALWFKTNGAEGERANLRGANLEGANLRGADLRGAVLREANLRGANLSGAVLWDAKLTDANLANANLANADLSGAVLWDAYLGGADLWGAKGIIQWQSPQGQKRICFSVKHKDHVMHQLGCFWGTTEEAVTAIREKYGEGSLYEDVLTLMTKCLESE